MASKPAETFKLPALIGRLGLAATYLAAVLLLGILAGNLYLLVPGHATLAWLPLFLDATPPVALLLGMLASYINYYGAWRILRRKDAYDVRSDLKSHAADIPAALQGLPADLVRRLGCTMLLSLTVFATALVATCLTFAPPPFQILGIATSPTPTPSPTAIPLVVKFALSPTQSSWDCNVSGRAIASVNVALDNTGSNLPVSWTLAVRETLGNKTPWATASPRQGAVTAGQRAALRITPSDSVCAFASPAGTDYHADITLADAGAYSFTYTIIGLKRVAFKLNPTQYPSQGAYNCATGNPPPVTITLDNSASNVDVGWSITMRETLPQSNRPWAVVDQSQGTVAAGQTAQVTLTPNPGICPNYAATPYHADIALSSGGSGTDTFTYSTVSFIG